MADKIFELLGFSEILIDDAQNPGAELIKYSRFGFSYLKLNSMVRYNHPVGKFKLLVDGGFSSGMGVGTENYLRTEYNEGDTHTVSKENALDEIEFVEFSFIGGIGGRYKDVSLNLRYELGSGPSGYETISSNSSRFYIIAGYQF
ncbi:MAG: hypothetical protein K9J27_12935 [Bacteroidales bacterium]|nr:hypothetical protein [Bacteroidales bacterium]